MELWKTIEDYPNYQVSNLGRVKSLCWGKERILKPCLNKGYWTVTLKRQDKQTCGKIYRLMAEAFIPNPTNLPVVDHINRDRADNCLDNLRWVSYSTNKLNSDLRINSNTGIHHVTRMTNGWFHVSVKRNKQSYQKNCKTLEEAVEWRDKATEESLEE